MENTQKDVQNGTDALLILAKELNADTLYGQIILEELLKTLLGVQEKDE